MGAVELRRNVDVDIVVRGWNKVPLTRRLLRSLAASAPGLSYQVYYIDGGSDRTDVAQLLLDSPELNLLALTHNAGSVRGLNLGLSQALLSGAKYVLMLDNDCEIPADAGWLARLCAYLDDETVGAVGAVSDKAGGFQGQAQAEAPDTVDVPTLDNFALLLRKAALQRVGLFDERYEPGLCEDLDYSIRLHEAGWQLRVARDVWLKHKGSQTLAQFDTATLTTANLEKLVAKWGADKLKLYGLEIMESTAGAPDARKISLLVPTLNRHAKLRAMLESVKPLVEADGQVEVVISPMEDDHVSAKIARDYPWTVVAARPDSERSAVAGFNWAYRHAAGDVLVVGGDDVDYCAPDFFQVIRAMVGQLPGGEGMVESRIGPLEAMQACTRAFVQSDLGGSFFCPHYYSWYANTEMTARAMRAHKYLLSDLARVAAPNPILDGSAPDATYKEGEAHHEADKALFMQRMAAGFPNDYPPLETR